MKDSVPVGVERSIVDDLHEHAVETADLLWAASSMASLAANESSSHDSTHQANVGSCKALSMERATSPDMGARFVTQRSTQTRVPAIAQTALSLRDEQRASAVQAFDNRLKKEGLPQ
jgi:hypothetical protein